MAQTRGNPYLRFLDRYLGIPAIRLLCRRKRTLPSIKTIGVLKLGGIGDLIVLSGIIKDLRAHYPDATITLFCGTENRAIASFIPGVTVVVLPLIEGVQILRRHQLDLLLDFEQWARIDVLMSYFSQAKYTVGFQTKGQHRHYLFDRAVPHTHTCHEIDNFRKIAAAVGVQSASSPHLHFPPCDEKLPERYVLFHPWSVSLVKGLKEWPRTHWIALGRQFQELGYAVFITGGKQDMAESSHLAEVMGATSLAGQTSFSLLAHYIQKAACTISVDTGVMHLAAALQVPLIALFGPTSPKRWGPLSQRATALSGGEPYMYLGFECPKNPPLCMEKILPEQVLDAFRSINYN